jgi:hypothetical protein
MTHITELNLHWSLLQGKRIIKNAVSGTHGNLVSYQFPGQVTQVGMGLFHALRSVPVAKFLGLAVQNCGEFINTFFKLLF